jgi:hypothetical protein
MTDARSQDLRTDPPTATGVATGSLGTAANLEDTQVFSSAELAAAAAAAAEQHPDAGQRPQPLRLGRATGNEPMRADPAEQAPATAASPVAVAVAAASADHAPTPAPPPPAGAQRVQGPVTTRRASSGSRGRGLAGVLAAALVVLAGVAFVVSQNDATIDAGQTLPSAAGPATTNPDQAGGGGNDADPGNGKGRGKDCNGNGNGRGCGGRNEGGDD